MLTTSYAQLTAQMQSSKFKDALGILSAYYAYIITYSKYVCQEKFLKYFNNKEWRCEKMAQAVYLYQKMHF